MKYELNIKFEIFNYFHKKMIIPNNPRTNYSKLEISLN